MNAPPMLRRPIMGGAFGQAGFELATQPTITNGLHAVRFMVIHLTAGQIVSIAEDKREALAAARDLLKATAPAQQPEPNWRQSDLWPGIQLVPSTPQTPVSRRRREVFERSGGVCFYCRCRLSIHAFEVEHQRPRALGGDDSPINLVASCSPCNSAKRDRTAIEFMAGQTSGRQSFRQA